MIKCLLFSIALQQVIGGRLIGYKNVSEFPADNELEQTPMSISKDLKMEDLFNAPFKTSPKATQTRELILEFQNQFINGANWIQLNELMRQLKEAEQNTIQVTDRMRQQRNITILANIIKDKSLSWKESPDCVILNNEIKNLVFDQVTTTTQDFIASIRSCAETSASEL